MQEELSLPPLQDPTEFIGDQAGYCDHLQPEMDHLLTELERLDREREARYVEEASKKASGEDGCEGDESYDDEVDGPYNPRFEAVLEPMRGEDPRLDNRAERALAIAVDCFVWQYGEILGIDKEDRRHLKFSDMNKEDMFVILSAMLPGDYKKVGLEIFRRIKRGEFVRALFIPYRDSDAPQNELTEVLSLHRSRHRDHEAEYDEGIRRPMYGMDYDLSDDSRARVVHRPGFEWADNHHENTYGSDPEYYRHQHMSVDLTTIRPARFERGRGKLGPDHFVSATVWKNALAYKCDLDLEQEIIESARFIKCTGKIRSTLLENCTITSGEKLEMDSCAFTYGKVELSGAMHVKSGFFHGTKIECNGDDLEEASFDFCDFSTADIDDDSLCKLAKRCQRCIFSRVQIDKIGDGGDHKCAEQFTCALDSMFSVDGENLAGPEGKQILDSRGVEVVADHLDRSRNEKLNPEGGDLADVPVLRNAGLSRLGKFTEDLRPLFPMLGSQEASRLDARLKFYPKLMKFLKKQREYKVYPQDLFNFIREVGEDACVALGLDPVFLELEIDVDKLPQHGIAMESRESNLKYDRQRKGINKPVPVVLKRASDGSFVSNCVDFGGETVSKCPSLGEEDTGELTVYARLQIITKQLESLGERLRYYFEYMRELLGEEHGYQLPEFEEGGSTIKLDGISHPNLPQILKDRKAIGKSCLDEPFPNNFELEPGRSQIIALSGRNASGKTLSVSGIIEEVAQAQAGAPCNGEVTVGSEGMYDHSLYMSTKKAKTGEGISGLESRAQILKEFLDQVDSLVESADGRPINVLVGFDEIIADATNPGAAATVEYNLVRKLMGKEGINITVLIVSHHTEVINKLKIQFPNDITIFGVDPDQDCHFIEKDEPDVSDPGPVLEEVGLAELLEEEE